MKIKLRKCNKGIANQSSRKAHCEYLKFSCRGSEGRLKIQSSNIVG